VTFAACCNAVDIWDPVGPGDRITEGTFNRDLTVQNRR